MILWVFFLCTTLASGSAVAAAGDEPVKLVSGPHFPPFSDEHLPSNGLGPFLAKRIFETSGRAAVLGFRPWKRAYRETLRGKYDVILPCIKTPGRSKDFLFSQSMLHVNTYIYVRADSQINAQSLQQLKGRMYCSPLGFEDGDALDKMRANGDITRISPSTLNNCFRMLAAGRVDFIKTNPYAVDYMGSHPDFSPNSIRALPFVVESESLHLMVPKSHPYGDLLIEDFDRSYSHQKKSGQLMEWTREYFERVKPEEESISVENFGHQLQ
jgi:polar amino acid transport system substrate-binding protein